MSEGIGGIGAKGGPIGFPAPNHLPQGIETAIPYIPRARAAMAAAAKTLILIFDPSSLNKDKIFKDFVNRAQIEEEKVLDVSMIMGLSLIHI